MLEEYLFKLGNWLSKRDKVELSFRMQKVWRQIFVLMFQRSKKKKREKKEKKMSKGGEILVLTCITRIFIMAADLKLLAFIWNWWSSGGNIPPYMPSLEPREGHHDYSFTGVTHWHSSFLDTYGKTGASSVETHTCAHPIFRHEESWRSR